MNQMYIKCEKKMF